MINNNDLNRKQEKDDEMSGDESLNETFCCGEECDIQYKDVVGEDNLKCGTPGCDGWMCQWCNINTVGTWEPKFGCHDRIIGFIWRCEHCVHKYNLFRESTKDYNKFM